MKKNLNESKNSSVQPQLSQKEVTPLSTLTLDELESVQGGGGTYYEKTPPAQTGTFGEIFELVSAVFVFGDQNFEYDGGEGCAYCG